MIYLFYGEDDFSLQESLSALKEEMGPSDLRDANITVFDGTRVGLDELSATCDTVPFLAPRRMVIVQGLLSLFERRAASQSRAQSPGVQGAWEGLPGYLETVPETTDLVFVEGRLSGSNPLLSPIRARATVRMFPALRPGEIKQWIRGRAAGEGMEIDPGAVDALAETIGPDLRVLSVELRKLATYRWGKAVRHEDVVELVSYTRDASIFAAVDAVLEGRPENAISSIHALLQAGRSPSYILAMIARQVRYLMLAKDLKSQRVPSSEQSKRLGLSGYPMRKTMEQEVRFSAERLAEIHRSLLEADVSIKTAGIDERVVLDVLVAEIASTPTGGSRGPSGRYARR